MSFSVEPGSFAAVIGPTGCGKSTTLSMICGTDVPDDGAVLVDGRRADGIREDVGFVFQTDAVFPWKTALDNVAAGPRFRGADRQRARSEAARWLDRVGLSEFERYYPHQLSGGMRKRVALAQTLINRPGVLLMDEPFGGLDAQTRALMSEELLALWEQERPSVVFVTHDLEEAVAVADKVVVLTAGPASVKQEFPVVLPRPRSAQEVRRSSAFVELHTTIWAALREEVAAVHDPAAKAV